MPVSKVVKNTPNGIKTIIDLTEDSVAPETLALGVTAHDKSGNLITGTLVDSKPTLYGTYAFIEKEGEVSGQQIELSIVYEDVCTYFNDGDGWFYDYVSRFVIAQHFTIYSEDSSSLKQLDDGVWHNTNGEAFTDERYKIIDFREPVTVTKEFYDVFMSLVDNDATPPFDLGYVIGQDDLVTSGYIKPDGTLEITENGTHDVTECASVNVNVPTGGGDAEADVAGLLGNTLTVLDNKIVTSLRNRACQGATKLVTVNLPAVTSLGTYAFYDCSNVKTIYLPSLQTVTTQPFYNCNKLTHIDCGNLKNITAQAFNACTSLSALILRKSDGICTLANTSGVNNSGIGKGTGYVYVPSALVDSYKVATNWSTYASQIRAIEDYPEICGG